MLSAIATVYPDSIARSALGPMIGKSYTAGGFRNDLGRLRTCKLIDYPSDGEVIATTNFFPPGLR
jgi:hypothetical protein